VSDESPPIQAHWWIMRNAEEYRRPSGADRPQGAGDGFVPALEGMRACAAIGVLITHVAFQTGSVDGSVLGRVWGRFDLAVAVYFALSGFLLWRPHARAARGGKPAPAVRRYLRHRAVRILPAYLVVVLTVLLLLPEARGASATVWLANLTLTQVYVPLTLTDGLTQMWSLAVEVAFYLVLPLLAWALVGLRGSRARLRVPVIALAALLSLAWAYLPVPTADGANADNWLPGYLSWFAAGMILAELAVAGAPAILASRPLMGAIAAVSFALAASPLGGPPGLVELAPREYAVKMLLGALLGFALLAPLTLGEQGRAHRFLASGPILALGRWSYAIFLWHLVVLMVVFPVFGIATFSGQMPMVLTLTLLGTIAVASVSYALIEEPARQALADWERRSSKTADTPTAIKASSAKS
jgi:peptidoglycan/LPS O-acetylase OafA/YrhL